MTSFLFGGGVIFHFTGQIFQAMGHLGSFGNVAMENPAFWWYLPGKMGIFMGYVSFREGIYESLPDFLVLYIQTTCTLLLACSALFCFVSEVRTERHLLCVTWGKPNTRTYPRGFSEHLKHQIGSGRKSIRINNITKKTCWESAILIERVWNIPSGVVFLEFISHAANGQPSNSCGLNI